MFKASVPVISEVSWGTLLAGEDTQTHSLVQCTVTQLCLPTTDMQLVKASCGSLYAVFALVADDYSKIKSNKDEGRISLPSVVCLGSNTFRDFTVNQRSARCGLCGCFKIGVIYVRLLCLWSFSSLTPKASSILKKRPL